MYKRQPLDGKECWARCGYSKLALWGLTEYTKLVYVDADAVVLENVDELFEIDVAFAAAPDIFPPDKFNAGVLVVRPCPETHARLLELAPTAPSYDGGDTGFLNHCFPGWFAGRDRLGVATFSSMGAASSSGTRSSPR